MLFCRCYSKKYMVLINYILLLITTWRHFIVFWYFTMLVINVNTMIWYWFAMFFCSGRDAMRGSFGYSSSHETMTCAHQKSENWQTLGAQWPNVRVFASAPFDELRRHCRKFFGTNRRKILTNVKYRLIVFWVLLGNASALKVLIFYRASIKKVDSCIVPFNSTYFNLRNTSSYRKPIKFDIYCEEGYDGTDKFILE